MLYIHTLKDLNQKFADVESIPLIREINTNNTFPLSDEKVKNHFSTFFVSNTDIEVMNKSLELIPTTIQDIIDLSKTKEYYELINIKRACSLLQEIPESLEKNINYAKRILEWQELFISQITTVLNNVPLAKNESEKRFYNERLNSIFEKLLRNKVSFVFNFQDIINEAQLTHIKDLSEGMINGFLFHIKLEEHLKKHDFDTIKKRIPNEEIEKVNAIHKKIISIKGGVERAYDHNMRMVTLSVILYSYIKWLKKI